MEFELFPIDPLNPEVGWTARFGIPGAWTQSATLTHTQAMELRNTIRATIRTFEAATS